MPPVGSTEKVVLTPKVLKIEYSGEDWSTDAKALEKKLLMLDGVGEIKLGEKGIINLNIKQDTLIDEKELKKLIKEAGMKFLSLADPEPEPED